MGKKYFTRKGVEFLLINFFGFDEKAIGLKTFVDFNYEDQEMFCGYMKILAGKGEKTFSSK